MGYQEPIDKAGLKRRSTVKKTVGFIAACLLLMVSFGASVHAAESWRDLSPKERENVLRNYQRWQNLPPQDKERLKDEWDRWRRLPPEQREKLRKRYDELNRSPDESDDRGADRNRRSRRFNDRNTD